jgi:hypothetical protein
MRFSTTLLTLTTLVSFSAAQANNGNISNETTHDTDVSTGFANFNQAGLISVAMGGLAALLL